MSEGPVSFGKPLMYLVIIGCIGGGYWAVTHWPSSYEGAGWKVDFPHGWEAASANDASDPTKVFAKGPLPEEGQGVGWAKIVYHGTLDWPSFMQRNLPGTADWTQDLDVDYKKAQMFMLEDQSIRYFGIAVDRGDAMVFVATGCDKGNFAKYKPIFEKVAKSVKCQR